MTDCFASGMAPSEHFSNADGLSSNAAGRLFQDAEGNVWAVTAAGLDNFRDLPV